MLTKNIETMKSEVARHIAADAVVAGQYWEATDNDVGGMGCFIACLAHSSDPAKLIELYGLPEPLTRICEHIFERLWDKNPKDSVAFFDAIPKAIGTDGKDLSRVHWAFLAEELRALPTVPADIQAVIDPVIVGMDLLASGQEWPKDAADAAARAARAAYAVDAARAADAARAVDAADAAARAAFAAARAVDADRDADAVIQRQRDTILRLIETAPMGATK